MATSNASLAVIWFTIGLTILLIVVPQDGTTQSSSLLHCRTNASYDALYYHHLDRLHQPGAVPDSVISSRFPSAAKAYRREMAAHLAKQDLEQCKRESVPLLEFNRGRPVATPPRIYIIGPPRRDQLPPPGATIPPMSADELEEMTLEDPFMRYWKRLGTSTTTTTTTTTTEAYFEDEDYPNFEMLFMDDGESPMVADLPPPPTVATSIEPATAKTDAAPASSANQTLANDDISNQNVNATSKANDSLAVVEMKNQTTTTEANLPEKLITTTTEAPAAPFNGMAAFNLSHPNISALLENSESFERDVERLAPTLNLLLRYFANTSLEDSPVFQQKKKQPKQQPQVVVTESSLVITTTTSNVTEAEEDEDEDEDDLESNRTVFSCDVFLKEIPQLFGRLNNASQLTDDLLKELLANRTIPRELCQAVSDALDDFWYAEALAEEALSVNSSSINEPRFNFTNITSTTTPPHDASSSSFTLYMITAGITLFLLLLLLLVGCHLRLLLNLPSHLSTCFTIRMNRAAARANQAPAQDLNNNNNNNLPNNQQPQQVALAIETVA